MKKLIAAVAVAALAVAMTGCKEKTASEKLQDKVEAAKDAGVRSVLQVGVEGFDDIGAALRASRINAAHWEIKKLAEAVAEECEVVAVFQYLLPRPPNPLLADFTDVLIARLCRLALRRATLL